MSSEEHWSRLERLSLAAPTNAYWQPRIAIGDRSCEIVIPIRPERDRIHEDERWRGLHHGERIAGGRSPMAEVEQTTVAAVGVFCDLRSAIGHRDKLAVLMQKPRTRCRIACW